MKRGLKDEIGMLRCAQQVGVSECSPMKRGLKGYMRLGGSGSFCGVSECSPMKRGLKANQMKKLLLLSVSFRVFPDEEGTESEAAAMKNFLWIEFQSVPR